MDVATAQRRGDSNSDSYSNGNEVSNTVKFMRRDEEHKLYDQDKECTKQSSEDAVDLVQKNAVEK
jgi:hypothetical protein